jgi:hypothetical protein
MDVKTEKSWRVKRRFGAIKNALGPFFPKETSIITQKRAVQPRDSFEDTLFEPGFEIFKF